MTDGLENLGSGPVRPVSPRRRWSEAEKRRIVAERRAGETENGVFVTVVVGTSLGHEAGGAKTSSPSEDDAGSAGRSILCCPTGYAGLSTGIWTARRRPEFLRSRNGDDLGVVDET